MSSRAPALTGNLNQRSIKGTWHLSCRLGAKRVEIRCDSRNLPSVRVAQRAGFLLEGELRNNEVATDGGLRDILIYAVTTAYA
jgi:RimJ/RimL family protein N-acetyltransferase